MYEEQSLLFSQSIKNESKEGFYKQATKCFLTINLLDELTTSGLMM